MSGGHGVAGSNPVIPTLIIKDLQKCESFFIENCVKTHLTNVSEKQLNHKILWFITPLLDITSKSMGKLNKQCLIYYLIYTILKKQITQIHIGLQIHQIEGKVMEFKIWSYLGVRDNEFTTAKIKNRELLRGVKRPKAKSWSNVWPKGLEVDITNDVISDAFTVGPNWVISPELANLLQSKILNESVFELLDVEVFNKEKKLEGYKLLNITMEINALNRQLSDFSLIGDEVDTVNKIHLDKHKCKGAQLFMLNCWQPIIVIHSRLVSEIKRNRITGIRFWEIEDWRPY